MQIIISSVGDSKNRSIGEKVDLHYFIGKSILLVSVCLILKQWVFMPMISVRKAAIWGTVAVVGLFTVLSAGATADSGEDSTPEPSKFEWPAQPEMLTEEQLRRLAASALRKLGAGYRHLGPVNLGRKLADGSYIVFVTLENGRQVPGRLYRDRRRYKISIDARNLFADEIIVVNPIY